MKYKSNQNVCLKVKDFKLMKKITEEGNIRNSDQFYKLTRVFIKERKNKK
jgi:hypothetical protein